MLTLSFVASAQEDYVPSADNIAARERFEDHRFGIFLHWGIYSMFAQGEWYLNKGINAKEYAKAAGGFYPAAFDAREWVKAIKASGARDKYKNFSIKIVIMMASQCTILLFQTTTSLMHLRSRGM